MPIRDRLIQEEAEKNVIVMDDAQTIRKAIDVFEERGYESENDVFLVVAEDEDTYEVISFLNLRRLLDIIGWTQLDTPVSELTLPKAGEIVERESESSGSFIDRVATSPGKTFVVVDGKNFVALFYNPNLSDVGAGRGVLEMAQSVHTSDVVTTVTISHSWRNPRRRQLEQHTYVYNRRASGSYLCFGGCNKWINSQGTEI